MGAVVHRVGHGLAAVTVAGRAALLAGLSAIPAAARPAGRGCDRSPVTGTAIGWLFVALALAGLRPVIGRAGSVNPMAC